MRNSRDTITKNLSATVRILPTRSASSQRLHRIPRGMRNSSHLGGRGMNARYSRCSGRTGESFDNGRDTTETTSRNVSTLVYLHTGDKPTVHRDIKPSNILVSYRDPHGDASLLYIKLSDFGLAKEGSVKSKCGTELYMAPETLKTRTPGYIIARQWISGLSVSLSWNVPMAFPRAD
jgi:serine/threonine protein kinase